MDGLSRRGQILACAALLLVVLAAYANHFQNGFHFDDSHTINGNVFLQDLRNVPRFFLDATTSSTMPDHVAFRPLVTTSLAIDYWLGHDYRPFFFHLSTFIWFALQLVLMFLLFRRIMDLADPHPANSPLNFWTALFAAACYGLHPANAETVNYIIQRADLYSTLGVVASLLWFVARPRQRKYGWYLIPAVAAFLSKAPALVFPFLLLIYLWLFEGRRQIRAAIPAFLVTAAAAILTSLGTPSTFHGGARSDALYRLTQPWVALHYFKSFFLPTELTADTDWTYVSGPFSGEALAGFLFVALLLAAAFYTTRRPETRPIAFGIFWFFLALAPTSLMPLAEVTNDHRMFFPFVGLVLSVFWALRLALPQVKTARAAIPVLMVIFAAEAFGTHQRNQVWRTEESLWRDVSIKSPRNGVGLMNYATTFISRGDYATALTYLKRTQALLPDYYTAELNLGIVYGGLGRDAEALQHFERALKLAPALAEPYYFYGRWLKSKGRLAEAQKQLETALQVNPIYYSARGLLIELYAELENWPARERLIEESLRLTHQDELARRYIEERSTPEALLDLSAKQCQAGNFVDCLAAARKAIELRPGYAEAYSNVAAAYIGMKKWDRGIEAAREALRLRPDNEAARSNLDWALTHKP